MTNQPDALRLVSGTVDLARRRATIRGEEVRLTTTEAALLRYLVEASGRAVSREEILRDVWGYSPDSLSRTVDVTMRRLRAKIEPDPAFPIHLLSVHGVGYTFVPAAEAGAEPAAPVEEAPPEEVPEEVQAEPPRPAPEGVIARAETLAAAWAQLRAGARPLTLAGPAGVGKTRLARALLDQARAGGQGAWFVDLGAATRAEDLALAVAAAFGVDRPEDRAISAALTRAGNALVVLDNFEQLEAAAVERLGRWLAAAPSLALLVTSRRRLGLLEEVVLSVDPLGVDDAVALFRRRARRVRADVQLDDEALLRTIVARLDGLPLAIELAAARVRALSLEELSTRLGLRFLRDASAKPARFATLQAAIDASWALLPAEGRRALAALATLPGATAVAVAERLLDRLGVDDPLGAVETLAEHSLLRIEEGPAGARLAPFVVVTEYAAARAAEAGIDPGGGAWIAALADTLGDWEATIHGAEARRAIARILAEADGVVAAVHRTTPEDPAAPDAVRAATSFHRAAELQGGHAAEVYVLDRVVALARTRGDLPLLGRLLSGRVRAHDRAGRLADACADADEVARLAATEPSLRDESVRAQYARATALRRAEQPEEAFAVLSALTVPASASAGFRSYVASERGLLLNRLGDPAAAAEAFQEALRIAVAGGEGRRAEMAFDHLALSRVDAGLANAMEPEIRAERDRRRAAGGDAQASPLNYVLGVIALESGRLEEARENFLAEQRSAEARGRVTAAAAGVVNLGLVELAAARPAAALTHFRDAFARYRTVRTDGIPLVVPVGLAISQAAAGERGVVLGVDPARVPATRVDRAFVELGEAVVAFAAAPADQRDAARARIVRAAADPATGVSDDLRALARFARGWFGE